MEPVGVDTMAPSPVMRVSRPSSVDTSSRTTRATLPLEITASFSAMLLYTGLPSRSTVTSSIIRDSTAKFQSFSALSRSSSLGSSSDMKPRLPKLMPSTGTLCSATVRARCRIVPSPPKAISISARLISCCSCRIGTPSWSSYPSRLKGRHTTVSKPMASRISLECFATVNSPSR